MYRNRTVREMKREWLNERLLYLGKIDSLLEALLLASGKPIPAPVYPEPSGSGYSAEMLSELNDFTPALSVYDLE